MHHTKPRHIFSCPPRPLNLISCSHKFKSPFCHTQKPFQQQYHPSKNDLSFTFTTASSPTPCITFPPPPYHLLLFVLPEYKKCRFRNRKFLHNLLVSPQDQSKSPHNNNRLIFLSLSFARSRCHFSRHSTALMSWHESCFFILFLFSELGSTSNQYTRVMHARRHTRTHQHTFQERGK
jgi:hypothetical protein